MRKILAAMALFAAPALAAIETTTITGTVYSPNGGAYPGKVTCTLSHAGTASDGVNQQVVASYYTATIGSDGALSFTLVPNDVITPAGTWYSCEYTVQPVGGRRMTWVKTYSVATSPDPVALGAVTILDNPTLTLPTITGTANSMMATDGSGGLVSTPALQRAASGNAVKFAGRYIQYDLDNDGTIDHLEFGDYNGDGTMDFARDFIAAVQPYIDSTGDQRFDINGDGTNDSVGMTFVPHGRFRAGFHDQLIFVAGGWTIDGYDAFIDVDADCSGSQDFNSDGTVDALDNSDTTQNFGSMFLYNASTASNITIKGLTIDGGSDQYLYTQLATSDGNYCDANDTDADGTANGSDSSPGTMCAAAGRKWCPVDEHFIFNASTTDSPSNLLWKDLTLRRCDSNCWEMDGGGSSGTGKMNWSIQNVNVFGSGEESVQLRGKMTVQGSRFERCGGFASDCLTLPTPSATLPEAQKDIDIVGNTFVDCVGPCIYSNANSVASGADFENLNITGNTLRNTTTYPQKGFVAITNPTVSASSVSHRRIAINSNTLDCGTIASGQACIQLLSSASSGTSQFVDGTINDNTIRFSGAISADTRQDGILVNRTQNYSISGNSIVDAANSVTSCGGGTEDRAITLTSISDSVVNGNVINMAADCSMGITTTTPATELTISQNRLQGPGDTANANYAIRGNPITDSLITGNMANAWDFGIQIASTSTGNALVGNQFKTLYNGAIQINDVNSVRNHVIGNTAESDAVGSCFQENAASVGSLWLGNTGRACSGLYSANMLASHGYTFQADTNNDGTNDATSGLILHKLTGLWGEGDTQDFVFSKLLFNGAGGATFNLPTLTATQSVTTTLLGTNTAAANLPFVRCGNASFDPASLGATTSGTTTVAVTNMEANAGCACSPRGVFNDDLVYSFCYATAGNLNVVIYNPTAGALDGGAITVDYCCTEQ